MDHQYNFITNPCETETGIQTHNLLIIFFSITNGPRLRSRYKLNQQSFSLKSKVPTTSTGETNEANLQPTEAAAGAQPRATGSPLSRRQFPKPDLQPSHRHPRAPLTTTLARRCTTSARGATPASTTPRQTSWRTDTTRTRMVSFLSWNRWQRLKRQFKRSMGLTQALSTINISNIINSVSLKCKVFKTWRKRWKRQWTTPTMLTRDQQYKTFFAVTESLLITARYRSWFEFEPTHFQHLEVVTIWLVQSI